MSAAGNATLRAPVVAARAVRAHLSDVRAARRRSRGARRAPSAHRRRPAHGRRRGRRPRHARPSHRSSPRSSKRSTSDPTHRRPLHAGPPGHADVPARAAARALRVRVARGLRDADRRGRVRRDSLTGSYLVVQNDHVGTHMDARKHIVPTAGGPETIPLEWCYGDGVLLDFRECESGYVITADDVKAELEAHRATSSSRRTSSSTGRARATTTPRSATAPTIPA